MTDFAPCPTCGQYSHSISDDTITVDLKELARIPALEAEVERLAKDLKSSEEEASWAEDDAVETANSLDKALAEVAFLTARLDEAEKEAAYLRDVVAAWKQIAG